MKAVKVLSAILALLMLLSVGSFAATSTQTTETQADQTTQESTTQSENATVLEEEFLTFLNKNELDPEKVCMAYYDFGRELRYAYRGSVMFSAYDAIKFPIAYLYYKDLEMGRFHINEDVGDDNLRTVFMRSLTKDFGKDGNATNDLIEKYGGMEAVKTALYEMTYTQVEDSFFNSDRVNAEYLMDFLSKYYTDALYCNSEFKHMLIDPIKQFTPARFCETYIYDSKITHRYGIAKDESALVDCGVVNSSNPFSFVIYVRDVENPESVIADIAEFLYDFNDEYGSLLLSQMTTIPDVPEKEKQAYDAKTITGTPLMIIVIVTTVIIAATVTAIYIVNENKKKERDRLD